MINYKNKIPEILVIGDLMVDQYLWGNCDRISPEAPVQIVKINQENKVLGGAGNVVNNLKQLGSKVDIISVIGDCDTSNDLKYLLNNIDVNTQYLVKQKTRILSKKTRIIAAQQQVVRYDIESNDDINNNSEKKLINTYKKNIKKYDLVLISDYGKGVLTNKVTKNLISIAKNSNTKVLVDPKGDDYSKYKDAFLLTPNKKEASEATKININDEKSLLEAIKKLKSDLNLSISLVTMSDDGIAIYDKELRTKPTVTREVFDVTGAGDTVLASLGFALACNSNIDDAVEFANLAAGVVVSKIGSATATIDEIIEHGASTNKPYSRKLIHNLSEIKKLCGEFKSRNRKIVFTNGCFDLLHLGHIEYLQKAKKLGDILIVGVNSDRSVSALKGNERPINNQLDRAYIIAALEFVDFVIIFDEDTPYSLIKLIRPNILVKGRDYEGQSVVGEDIADKLVLIEFTKNKSSTKIIEKIKKETK